MMKHAIDFIHRFLQGNRVEPDEVLWAILISAFVFASLHLVTMFLTRRGDRRVTGKGSCCSRCSCTSGCLWRS